MQKEYSNAEYVIVNTNIIIYNKLLELNELNNITKNLGNNISGLGNNYEITRFTKIKQYYDKKISTIKKEIILLCLYMNRKEAHGKRNNKRYIIKKKSFPQN